MRIIILSLALLLNGCASAFPAWWTANKVYLFEAGLAAGALTQIEQLGLTTKQVIEEVKK